MKEFVESNRKFISGVIFTLVLAIVLSILLGITPSEVLSGTITITDRNETEEIQEKPQDTEPEEGTSLKEFLAALPEYDGAHSYVVVNNNIPFFTEKEKENTEPFLVYSELDDLGRAGVAYANLCCDMFNEGTRKGDLSQITPSGWHQVNTRERFGMSLKYEETSTDYLFARSHLIAWSLGGSELDPRGIITATTGCNLAMLEVESAVREFLSNARTDHVLYRVTPVYRNSNDLLPCGVLMEGYAVENKGLFISYNIFIFNAQPELYGVAEIDYETGKVIKP